MFDKELFEKEELKKRGISDLVKVIVYSVLPENSIFYVNEHNGREKEIVSDGGLLTYDNGKDKISKVSSKTIEGKNIIGLVTLTDGEISRLVKITMVNNDFIHVLINDNNDNKINVGEIDIKKNSSIMGLHLTMCYHNDVDLNKKEIYTCDSLRKRLLCPKEEFSKEWFGCSEDYERIIKDGLDYYNSKIDALVPNEKILSKTNN